MSDGYSATIGRRDGAWIGWIAEVPGANCQEPTREGLLGSLRATLLEALELAHERARAAAPDGFERIRIVS